MKISRERLLSDAESTGFRPEVLEKAILLLRLLDEFRKHPFLKGRLVLKGGTALNLFVFDLPRLSVDIDLNYIGTIDRETMITERPKVEKAISAVCSREGFNIRRISGDHAGGKFSLRYESALGHGGNLEIDLNFIFRAPLWPVTMRDSCSIASYKVNQIPILDIHELAAGKITALFSRKAARDLFDVNNILRIGELSSEKLRLAFVFYGAINRKDWREILVDDIIFNPGELENSLIPLLRNDFLKENLHATDWAAHLVDECRQYLGMILPLVDSEQEFLNRLLDHGEIVPSLLTKEKRMAELIRYHPGLEWKAMNVREFKVT